MAKKEQQVPRMEVTALVVFSDKKKKTKQKELPCDG